MRGSIGRWIRALEENKTGVMFHCPGQRRVRIGKLHRLGGLLFVHTFNQRREVADGGHEENFGICGSVAFGYTFLAWMTHRFSTVELSA